MVFIEVYLANPLFVDIDINKIEIWYIILILAALESSISRCQSPPLYHLAVIHLLLDL